jgi:hypothetical protein
VSRTIVYDTGMLIGLAKRARIAHAKHEQAMRYERPIVPGPVLSQVWRDSPRLQATLSHYLKDCLIHIEYDEDDYRRVGLMLGDSRPSGKKRPDFVDALVAYTAAGQAPAAVVTSDPLDILTYLDALPRPRVAVIPV